MSAGIGAAALVVGVGVLVSRLLGLARSVLVGALLGTSVETSLWASAFVIPDLMYFVMAGGYLSITLVPVLGSRLQLDGGEPGVHTNTAFRAVFVLVGGAVALVTALLLVGAGPLVALLFPRVGEQAYLVRLTRISMASQIFFGLGTMLMAGQYARKRFVIPSLAPVIYNLGIIAGGLVGLATGDRSAEPFIWGGLVGAAVGNFGLQWWGAQRAGYRLGLRSPTTGRVAVPWKHQAVKEYLTTAFPLMVGISAVAFDEQWPRLFGWLVSKEAAGELTFARSLNMMPVGIIAQAAGVAAYPFLVTLVAQHRLDDLTATVRRSMRNSVAIGGLAAALACGAAVPLVTLAFQRGEFDDQSTSAVAGLLLLFGLSIPLWPAHQVYTRAFYAMSSMWTPVALGSAITLVLVPAMWLSATRIGASGVAAASTAGIAAYTLGIAAVWHRSVSPSDAASNALFAVKVGAATGAAGLAARLATGLFELGTAFPAALLDAVLSCVAGSAVYLLAARLLAINEVNGLLARLRPPFLSRGRAARS